MRVDIFSYFSYWHFIRNPGDSKCNSISVFSWRCRIRGARSSSTGVQCGVEPLPMRQPCTAFVVRISDHLSAQNLLHCFRLKTACIQYRSKAFNIIALVEFCSIKRTQYTVTKLPSFAHNRRPRPMIMLCYERLCSRMKQLAPQQAVRVNYTTWEVNKIITVEHTGQKKKTLIAVMSGQGTLFLCLSQLLLHVTAFKTCHRRKSLKFQREIRTLQHWQGNSVWHRQQTPSTFIWISGGKGNGRTALRGR